MATAGGIAAGLLGSAASEAAAFAAGLAIGPTLAPEIEFLKNEAWNAAQTRALEPGVAAEIAAENVDQYATMAQQAAYHGVAGALFKDLYGVTLNAPGTGELLAMLRRGTINPGNFTHGLRKAKLEPMWDAGLADLANQKISATDLAYMMVRGVLPDEGLLGMSLPTHADRLKLPPQLPLNPVSEAALTGWDRERLAAMVARSGLAMAPVMAAQANFRGILTDNDYLLTIARGDLFPAYAGPVREVAREIPTAEQFVEAHLRGWITQQAMYDGAALHGMSQPHADLEFQIHRRPLTPRQITQALAWGGNFNPEPGEIQDPYVASVHQENLGPEWYGLGEALKHTYSVPFWWRSMTQSGDLGPQEAETILLRLGNPPAFATTTTQHFAGSTTAAGDSHVTKAETQLWNTAHASYKASEIDNPTATAAIEAAGVSPASAPAVLALWAHERSLVRKQLTPTQIRKALNQGVVNPATGQPWTVADAHAALLARGYDSADATVFLEE